MARLCFCLIEQKAVAMETMPLKEDGVADAQAAPGMRRVSVRSRVRVSSIVM